MKCFRFFTVFLLAALVLPEAGAQTLLTYWNFNNNSTAYSGGSIGSFGTSAAAYGETFTAVSNRLSSNTANGAVFSSSGIYMDLTNMTSGFGGPAIVNGIIAPSTRATTSASNGGFGTFSDGSLNQVAGDSTSGGSLFLMDPSAIATGHYITLALSSAGYEDMTLTYANRLTNASTLTETWSYSTDGVSFTTFSLQPTMTTNGSFYLATLNMAPISAIENQATFYLRMTIGGAASSGGSGSLALDNIQLNGIAVVPEPTTYALVGLGLGALWFLRRRTSSVS